MDGDIVRGVMGRVPGGEPQSYRGLVTVGADGGNSIVARRLGLLRRRPTHRKLALGCHYDGIQAAGEGAEIYIGRSLYGILNHQKHGCVNISIVVDCGGLKVWKGRLDGWWKDQERIGWKIVEWRDQGKIKSA